MENILHKPLFEKWTQQKAVFGQILKLLDGEGHCPSGVHLQRDEEGNWDENTYRLLANECGLNKNVSDQVLNSILSAITGAVKAGDKVTSSVLVPFR